MKQILQDIKSGRTYLENVPTPLNKKNNVIIHSTHSLLSPGTERMLINFSKSNLIGKALSQPEKVNQVISKVKTDGVLPTIEAIKSKLDNPIPLGYCNVGVVNDSECANFVKGDRVISNGPHAEVIRVNKNLCAKIPNNVSDETASFSIIGSIGLQGIRLINPAIGEFVIVYGLGLIGLIAIQILKANGCEVIGIDNNSYRCQIAKQFGINVIDSSKDSNVLASVFTFTKNKGADSVLITASSKSNEIIQNSAKMCRVRGKIVLVGVVGLDIKRDDFYKKEITFQVSSSYGPGRYDHEYEENGNDYPYGFVRWTEQRNFEAILKLMSHGQINVEPLITNKLTLDESVSFYEKLLNDANSLGILIQYSKTNSQFKNNIIINKENFLYKKNAPIVGCVGAGNYASRILIPNFIKSGANLECLVSESGLSATIVGKKYKFKKSSSDVSDILKNDQINTFIIATRHDSHAHNIILGLKHRKNIFVEKPLAINLNEVDEIETTYYNLPDNDNKKSFPIVMVGFNRRFAPLVIKMKKLMKYRSSAKNIIITINAGKIDHNHWIQNTKIGGKRIIGEGCHFIDLARHLVGHKIDSFSITSLGNNNIQKNEGDKVTINLSFNDGSQATIHYLANGGKSFQKERIEVFCDELILQLNNFRSLLGYDWKGFKSSRLLMQDKGQKACVKEFLRAIREGSPSPIPMEEIIEVSKKTIEISNSI